MANIDTDQRIRSGDPAWYFLVDLSLSEILADHRSDERTDGLWVQTVRDLGVPLECVDNIKRTLTGFARDAWGHFKQGRLEAPGRMRLFCQQKIIDDANSTETTRFIHTEQAPENEQMIHHSSSKMNGGWGYFLIERGVNVSAGSPGGSWISVDLYLYKEGE